MEREKAQEGRGKGCGGVRDRKSERKRKRGSEQEREREREREREAKAYRTGMRTIPRSTFLLYIYTNFDRQHRTTVIDQMYIYIHVKQYVCIYIYISARALKWQAVTE